jgi:hypothetical protein
VVYFRDKVTELVWNEDAGGVEQVAEVEEVGMASVETVIVESEKTQA